MFLPVSWLYLLLAFLRKKRLLKTQRASLVPVIVVGNISVGGTGKTPLVVTLVQTLKAVGYHPAIISRGYGSTAENYPFSVMADSNVGESGDEPLLLAQRCQCPVMIGANRNESIDALLQQGNVNVIVSDDGLQHYCMQRQVEIAVVDGSRGLGNGICLPAGPLREKPQRLMSVDKVVSSGQLQRDLLPGLAVETMHIKPTALVNVLTGEEVGIEEKNGVFVLQYQSAFDGKLVHALAGIGNPQRFFQLLDTINFDVSAQKHVFPDHHPYQLSDLAFGINESGPIDNNTVVITTEKDAVKLRPILKTVDTAQQGAGKEKAGKKKVLPSNFWYVKISAQLSDQFFKDIISKLD